MADDQETARRRPQQDDTEARITWLFARALAERSFMWATLAATTGMTAYAVYSVEGWHKLAGVAGYAILVQLPLMGKLWRKLS